MILYGLTIVLVLLSIISIKRDARKLINIFLLFFALVGTYLSLISLAYERAPQLHEILLTILYKVLPVAVLGFALLMIVNGIIILRKEGKSLANALSLAIGISILGYFFLLGIYLNQASKRPIGEINLYSYQLFHLISFLFAVVTIIFVAFWIYTFVYVTMPLKKDYDFIIIHGSGLLGGDKVTPLLKGRIEKGIEAYQLAEKKTVKFIASGGQGPDEKISEAKAISDYLLSRGIPKEAILLEDKSRTTFENLKYSKDMAQKELDDPKYIFISNNYHVFRASLYARKLKMKGEGVGSKTARYYLPSAFIREYVAILLKLKYVLLALAMVYLIFYVISYM
ncbi:YdcF family protein [Streptococcus catagoni]|uniref:YdcF family protein n=1 Tax=Streptococcus catagoni TaxID=2654874 RepID=UPI00140AD87C|nr:YdcF family protein [Streptococcus catagoni]